MQQHHSENRGGARVGVSGDYDSGGQWRIFAALIEARAPAHPMHHRDCVPGLRLETALSFPDPIILLFPFPVRYATI
jgi:hypothetical protein